VQFQSPGAPPQSTRYQKCQPSQSSNFYLSGLRGGTQYSVQPVIDSGTSIQLGASMTFTTGTVTKQLPKPVRITTDDGPAANGILLQSLLLNPAVVTDLNGNVVWYSPGDITLLTRPTDDGTFMAIGDDPTKDQSAQFFREFDLAGVTRAETNAARVNEQL